MEAFREAFNSVLSTIGGFLWSDTTIFVILATGIIFTIWTKFAPVLALTHGVKILFGRYDKKGDPGAISHFQALSAALSATVGLGNISGVALAVAIGGPGAVFWMWVVGLVGMSLKTTEVSLSMIFRDTSDPDHPRGGPMWVAQKGFAEISPMLAKFGKTIGAIFCVTLLISSVTGGNMFQAWSVADVTHNYFSVPKAVTGIILALICGAVIIGGIKRIGTVAGRLVPFMCGLYFLCGILVVGANIDAVPGIIRLIFASAFNAAEAQGAFLGGTVGFAFLIGMKRALFSNEAGQGSAPIAHCAAKTAEPIREGVLAGLEPFIDTLVVCTLTALVILSSGIWNRSQDAQFATVPEVVSAGENQWTLTDVVLGPSPEGKWKEGQDVFVHLAGDLNVNTGNRLHQVVGTVRLDASGSALASGWTKITSANQPTLSSDGFHLKYVGATLTALAFDRAVDGLGMWLVTLASWLFAISTMISWSYYGEQGMIYLAGKKSILPYKVIYCILAVIATLPIVRTTDEILNLSDLGTGVMLFVNIPICLIMGKKVMGAYHDYVRRYRAGEFEP